jgi:hypothetical protein
MFNKNVSNLKYNLEQGKNLNQYTHDITSQVEKNYNLMEIGSTLESFFSKTTNQPIQMMEFKGGEDEMTKSEKIDQMNDIRPDLSLIENLSTLEFMNNLSNSDKQKIEGLSNIENDYNKLLSEYSKLYQQFSDDLLNKNQSKKLIIDNLGKVISDTDGNNYYVNNFGYTQKYSTSAWQNNNSTCPTTATNYSGDLNNFKIGIPMNSGQPCQIAGKIIQNTSTSEKAWVDIKGLKHPFSGTAMSNSCSMNAIKLGDSDYNLIPSGSAMSRTDTCVSLDVNPTLYSKLQTLNSEIKIKANELINEMNALNLSNTAAQNALVNKQNTMMKHVDNISKYNKQIKFNNNMLMQVSGDEEDAELRMKSNWMMYMIWIFVMILIVMLVMANSSSMKSNSISGITYVVVGIGILLFLFFLYKKSSSVSIQIN